MTFQDQLTSDWARMLSTDYFATSITYKNPAGQETTLTAVVFDVMTEQRETNGVTTIMLLRDCTWATSQLSTVNLKATMIVSDVEWAISRIMHQDSNQITVRLERHTLHEQTRERFRRT